MGQVYSHLFIRANSPGPATYSYTVPAGYRAIVRDSDTYAGGSISSSGDCFFDLDGVVYDWFTVDVDTTVVHQWRGRQVAESGSVLTVTITGIAMSTSVSGYLLTLP